VGWVRIEGLREERREKREERRTYTNFINNYMKFVYLTIHDVLCKDYCIILIYLHEISWIVKYTIFHVIATKYIRG